VFQVSNDQTHGTVAITTPDVEHITYSDPSHTTQARISRSAAPTHREAAAKRASCEIRECAAATAEAAAGAEKPAATATTTAEEAVTTTVAAGAALRNTIQDHTDAAIRAGETASAGEGETYGSAAAAPTCYDFSVAGRSALQM
jgi:hypothetical protein